MKNILRKIGVIGIIIAMLAPFIELPVVKAANEECTDHTVMQYLFLDVVSGGSKDDWINYASTGGYATYTRFANLFPNTSADKTVKIIDVKTNYVSTDDLSNYFSSMRYLLDKADDYSDLRDKTKSIGTYSSKDVKNITYVKLLHGSWAKEDGSTKDRAGSFKDAGWYGEKDGKGDETEFIKEALQTYLAKKSITLSSDNVKISSAKYYGSNILNASDEYSNLKDFFSAVANNEDDELTKTDGSINYLALRIQRNISDTDLKKFTFGYNDSGTYYKWGDYTKIGAEGEDGATPATQSDIDILSSNQIYWPVVLNVEYEVCPTTSEQWTLKYDGNTDDNSVTNIPGSQTETIGTDIQIDAKKPSRDGYTFQGWNTQRDGKGTPYNAEDTYKSPSEKTTVTLYAQWGKGGTEDNKKTGVMSYVVGFITTGLVASGIYLVAKKKNLFKQI